MITKRIFSTILLIMALVSTSHAVPLDADHFKAGVWRGRYIAMPFCAQKFSGTAILMIHNPVYKQPTPFHPESTVNFDGFIKLNGPIPPGFEQRYNLTNASRIIRYIPNGGSRYQVALVPTAGHEFIGFFLPVIENIQVKLGSMTDSRCVLQVNLSPVS